MGTIATPSVLPPALVAAWPSLDLGEVVASTGNWTQEGNTFYATVDGSVAGAVTSPLATLVWRISDARGTDLTGNLATLVTALSNLTLGGDDVCVVAGLADGVYSDTPYLPIAYSGAKMAAGSQLQALSGETVGADSDMTANAAGATVFYGTMDFDFRGSAAHPGAARVRGCGVSAASDAGAFVATAYASPYSANLYDPYLVVFVWNATGSGAAGDVVSFDLTYKAAGW